MHRINFTKVNISKLKSRNSRYIVGDTKCNGLCVRVSPSGYKSYIVYKKFRGKPIRVTLGSTDDLSIEQARKKAQKKISLITFDETNPNELKKLNEVNSICLGEVFKQYMGSRKFTANTVNGYSLCINRDLKDWKNRPLNSITGSMVSKRHHELSLVSETTANKVMRVLRAVFNYADLEYEDEKSHQSSFAYNPTKKLRGRWNRETSRKNIIANSQLNDWFDAVLNLPKIIKGGNPELARDYLQFVLLNGLRRREATKLDWGDIDLQGLRFVIRDPKNHEDLWLPLTDYSKNLLLNRKEAGAEIPFQIEDPRKSISAVRKHSGVYFTIHDLRRTFITKAESMDIGIFTIKALVNHKSNNKYDITESYAQIDTERLRKPLQDITDNILRAANLHVNNVVSIANK